MCWVDSLVLCVNNRVSRACSFPAKPRRGFSNSGFEALEVVLRRTWSFHPLSNKISGSCIIRRDTISNRVHLLSSLLVVESSVTGGSLSWFARLACEGFSHCVRVCRCPTLHLKHLGKEHEVFFLFFPRGSAEASAPAKSACHHMFKK